jgi:hypothetical protein
MPWRSAKLALAAIVPVHTTENHEETMVRVQSVGTLTRFQVDVGGGASQSGADDMQSSYNVSQKKGEKSWLAAT